LTQQSILGAFAPSNQPTTHAPKSYAEATHGLKLKEPAQQALKQPAQQQPQQLSRKRADPQSDPKGTPTNTTQLAPPPMDEEEEPEDTPFFIQLAQLAEDKKDIKSEDVATFMKFLLSRLEGLDATPDGMDKGRKGPWIFYVDDDAHDQFKAAYGDKLQTVLSGVPHEFGVTYGTIADSAPHLPASNNQRSFHGRVSCRLGRTALCLRACSHRVFDKHKFRLGAYDRALSQSRSPSVLGSSGNFLWPTRGPLRRIRRLLRASARPLEHSGAIHHPPLRQTSRCS